MKKALKFISMLLVLLCAIPMLNCRKSNKSNNSVSVDDIKEYCYYVANSGNSMNEYSDIILKYWYNAIDKNAYGGSIETAIEYAQRENASLKSYINALNNYINTYYEKIRGNSPYKTEINAIMSAYINYYRLVTNISGSYNSFSADSNAYSRTLYNALNDLYAIMPDKNNTNHGLTTYF